LSQAAAAWITTTTTSALAALRLALFLSQEDKRNIVAVDRVKVYFVFTALGFGPLNEKDRATQQHGLSCVGSI